MPFYERDALRLHWREDGDPEGAPLILLHGLGSDLTVFDTVLPLLPPGLRLLRIDLRGHGQSTAPSGDYAMGALIRDVEELIESLGIRDAVVCGLCLGGMIAQGLAVKRLDLVRALILSNTTVKMATPVQWQRLHDLALSKGMEAVAAQLSERWFGPAERRGAAAQAARETLCAMTPEGFAGACMALAGTDFLTPTSGLRLSTLVLAASHDGMTPPDLIRELSDLIPGSEFRLLKRAGHLPPLDAPSAFAEAVAGFLQAIGERPAPQLHTTAAATHDHDHDHDHDHGHRHGPHCHHHHH